jgi:hypothetical protein
VETEDHVLKAEHIDPIKSCLNRGALHVRLHLDSKRQLLTPALKEIRRTRAKHLLQWHTKNGHENILFFMDEKIFAIEEQYNNQYNKIYAQMSLEVHSKGAEGHHPSYVMVWWGVYHQGVTPLHFCEKDVKTGAQVCQEDVLQGIVKPLNKTVFSGQKWVFQQDSAPAYKAKTTQVAAEETSGLYKAPRFGPRGVQTSTLWTINCGLFWRTWLAENITTTWIA